VEDEVGTVGDLPAGLEITEIPFNPLVAPLQMSKVRAMSRTEVVGNAYTMSLTQQPLDQVRADEASPPGHDDAI
jgi:hypothetical protein